MASIIYKSLSSLSPIELKYEYYRDEKLLAKTTTYQDGFSFYELDGFNNFQDVTINRSSVLVLTNSIPLTQVFTPSTNVSLGKLPGTFEIQTRRTNTFNVKYNPNTFSFNQTTESASIFSVQPIDGTNEVELFVDSNYVQVEAEYPYKVYLNDRALDFKEINRQRFQIYYDSGLITIKTRTNSGYRYLAFNNDNILRATGLVLNNTTINDYIFKCKVISNSALQYGFIPSNDWITYYFDVEDGSKNKTVTINKNFTTVPTNLLIDFSVLKGANTGTAKINIANLKTSLTPSGGPAPVENAYSKETITIN